MTCIQKGWRMQMILKFLSSNGKSLPSSNQTWQWKILICRDAFPSYKPSFTDDFQLPPLITGRYIINFIFVTFPNSSIPNKPEFRMIHQPQWPKKASACSFFCFEAVSHLFGTRSDWRCHVGAEHAEPRRALPRGVRGWSLGRRLFHVASIGPCLAFEDVFFTLWLWLTVCHGKSPFLLGKP
jgi:hypothetical protein